MLASLSCSTQIVTPRRARMNLRDAYITGSGVFLPGDPVANDRIEDFIGRVGGRASSIGPRALRWNGIRTRHYALTPQGEPLHSNASMSAKAVQTALADAGLGREDLQMLATATTQGDYLVPGHASAVHGELGGAPLELASFQSVCASSLMALKAAALSVRTGEHECAATVASEFSSRWFRPGFYEDTTLLDGKGRLAMEADFLRFTLSDGAGALVLESKPRRDRATLRIEWIDLTSLAGSYDPCMWAGAPQAVRADMTQAWSHAGPKAAHADRRNRAASGLRAAEGHHPGLDRRLSGEGRQGPDRARARSTGCCFTIPRARCVRKSSTSCNPQRR